MRVPSTSLGRADDRVSCATFSFISFFSFYFSCGAEAGWSRECRPALNPSGGTTTRENRVAKLISRHRRRRSSFLLFAFDFIHLFPFLVNIARRRRGCHVERKGGSCGGAPILEAPFLALTRIREHNTLRFCFRNLYAEALPAAIAFFFSSWPFAP